MTWPYLSVMEFTNNLSLSKYILVMKCPENCDIHEDPEVIELTVTNVETTYSGKIMGNQLDEMATSSRLSKREFIVLTLQALTTKEDTTNKFIYEIGNLDSNKDITLTWKYQPSEEIKFILGRVELSSVNNAETLFNILNMFGKRLREVDEKNVQEIKSKTKVEIENKKLSEFVEKHILEKEELEKEMYAKFVCVLNEKKRQYNEKIMAENDSSSEESLQSEKSPVKVILPIANAKIFGDLGLNCSFDDELPEPSQLKRKIRKKLSEEEIVNSKKPRSPPPPHYLSSDTDRDSDELLDAL